MEKHTLCIIIFSFRKFCLLWDKVQKKNPVEPDTPQMKIWRVRIACCIPNVTNTHSQYVIHNDLHKGASMLALYVRCCSTLRRAMYRNWEIGSKYTRLRLTTLSPDYRIQNSLTFKWPTHFSPVYTWSTTSRSCYPLGIQASSENCSFARCRWQASRNCFTPAVFISLSHNYYSNKMHTFIIKSSRYYNLYFFVLYFAPTCFNPRGSSSGGSMPVPG
jgi:hypothetical protein